MKLPASPFGVTSMAGLVEWLRNLASSIAAGWQVEHNADGRHAWVVERPIPFNAARFSALSPMTWSVDAGDVTEYSYVLLGDVMTLTFRVTGSTVGGTVTALLQLALPTGFAAVGMWQGVIRYADNGSLDTGTCQVSDGARVVVLVKRDSSNWTLSSNNTTVVGTITLRVQRD